eukprot:2934584-Rhodomonas_salina.2
MSAPPPPSQNTKRTAKVNAGHSTSPAARNPNIKDSRGWVSSPAQSKDMETRGAVAGGSQPRRLSVESSNTVMSRCSSSA